MGHKEKRYKVIFLNADCIVESGKLTVVVTFVPGPGNRSFDNGTSLSSAGNALDSTSMISVLYDGTVFLLVDE